MKMLGIEKSDLEPVDSDYYQVLCRDPEIALVYINEKQNFLNDMNIRIKRKYNELF